ncbi:TRAP transporter substrate-binding protein [Geoalkalibacter halelectricus]|uniref:TRAP transporter substrate-binding protein n=1 Tax=Geoalkalibacter halelectricus TaxID=2847045 RepID=A0ABY5ZM70_9BACT|nr:TRAP transporter substrate-binding protein [Geoalkalibacter halelectricus]MDO3378418.1 TRAP transporter substrate-binding protein [Geoalkalibacter halelectricus]UWZ80262.1 TRAP transporter substrate-binding protein [Geoalkalibacter halelectricus]
MAKKSAALGLALLASLFLLFSTTVHAQDDPLASWRPAFDPSGAQHTYLLSNIDHPSIEGIGVGFRIRDKVWERSEGRLYVDFRPLAQLGGERDVLQKLRLGAIHGMMCSSVAAANLSPRLGIVNLPFVVDSFEKLETFRNTPELFEPFSEAARPQGVSVVDFTTYGGYGWATTTPVANLEDAARVNFRIAEAPVNTDLYRAWGLRFTVMPWPDVHQALQTGVINGLDHTLIVCSITRKFDVARYFTPLDYAQGLYIHMINTRWLERLPADLRAILLETIQEESAAARERGRVQYEAEIARVKAAGVTFLELPEEDRARLRTLAEPVYERWAERIGPEYLELVRTRLADEN